MGNVAIISGTITRDADLRQAKNGSLFVALTVATERPLMTRDNIRKMSTTYHRVVIYGKDSYLQNHILPRAQQGRYVIVRGEIRNSSFPGDDGHRIKLSEIVTDLHKVEFAQQASADAERVS